MTRLVPDRPPRLALTVAAALSCSIPLAAVAGGSAFDPDSGWIRVPDRYLLAPTVLAPAPVTHHVVYPLPPPPPPLPPPIVYQRSPYDTTGLVVAGAGMGGLILHVDGKTVVSPSYRLHVGLAVGQAEFALRLNMTPDALELDLPATDGSDDVEASKWALYLTRAAFDYRFLPQAIVHPVAGVGLGWLVAAPEEGRLSHMFAVGGRVGLELAFALDSGALALGLDGTIDVPFTETESTPIDRAALFGFGAYLDYRF